MEVESAGRGTAAEAVLVGFENRVRAGAPVEEDHDPWAAGIAEEDLSWSAAAAAELQLVAAAEQKEQEEQGQEQEAAQNQAVLEGIQAAVEAPELPEVYPGTEREPGIGDKVADQPGNVEAGGMKTGPGFAGSKEVHSEAEEDLTEPGSMDAGSLGCWNAAEGKNPADGLREE